MSEQRKRRLRISRDTAIFLLGVAGIIYETLVSNGDRPTLLVLFGAMIGLPTFLSSDEKRHKGSTPPAVLPSDKDSAGE